ncbi:MAG: T9SS type A sorting domain-containing protein [Cyclobacteriaceae bacterium]
MKTRLLVLAVLLSFSALGQSTHSIARQWNEVLLEAIRNDYARPTVHARNLFHTSAMMYDCWAMFEADAGPYFLGRELGGVRFPEFSFDTVTNIDDARKEVLSYAMYSLLRHRFETSPGYNIMLDHAKDLMKSNDYLVTKVGTDYQNGGWAELGNYLANLVIAYGFNDYSNEEHGYVNQHYEPVNEPLRPQLSGNPEIEDLDRWQPLLLNEFVDQSGQLFQDMPEFLSPEWGRVLPFALGRKDLTFYPDGPYTYWVYHDPGPPPAFGSEAYNWGFSMVGIWSGHLDPSDQVMWDISPASQGNLGELPTRFEDYPDYYKYLVGGDRGTGYEVNPKTEKPYTPQWVPRGDYTRTLAEFWADGPDSETPPGHWFTILNYVNDHPLLEKKLFGKGEVVSDLEWDVKNYLALGGAMHDAAIAAWGVKGYYDYIRPISALRYLAGLGQGSNDGDIRFNENGLPLIEGSIELVRNREDPLSGQSGEHIGKIKIKCWKGPDYVRNPELDYAGVDWILAENWWPYQRPTFVTPPFAGYVSGHSTFSRAAAVVLHAMTGDAFFPGGMASFEMKKNEFLVFEEGPSQDIVFQWATYYDASDQCSLSRIWGGIHPPADDMPGRIIGQRVGEDAVNFVKKIFADDLVVTGVINPDLSVYPNPVSDNLLRIDLNRETSGHLIIIDTEGRQVYYQKIQRKRQITIVDLNLPTGIYIGKIIGGETRTFKFIKK